MKVENHRTAKIFGNILTGTVFLSNSVAYLKISEHEGETNSINAVDLANGHSKYFDFDTIITPCPDAKVILL